MTNLRVLAREEARRIAVRGQLLSVMRPVDLLETIDRLTLLQLDPTSVVAPNTELVAWSRIGEEYEPETLRRAREENRTVFEHRHREDPSSGNINVLRPMSAIGWYLAEMEELLRRPGRVNEWLEANAGFVNRVLDQLEAEGPLMSRDIPDTADVAWKSTGWTDGRNTAQLLEFLASRGRVAVAGRVGRQRTWDLAHRVYPQNVEVLSVEDGRHRRDVMRLRSLGVARPKIVGKAGETVEVEGTNGLWRVDPDASASGFKGRAALLSPFDRLIHDHRRAMDLFDFEYLIELYKPKANRRWGYFALPVLHDDQLVGKIDMSANRQDSKLDIHAIHEDIPFTRDIRNAVDDEMNRLASWLGLDGVRLPDNTSP